MSDLYTHCLNYVPVVTTYCDKSNVEKEGFILCHSSKVNLSCELIKPTEACCSCLHCVFSYEERAMDGCSCSSTLFLHMQSRPKHREWYHLSLQ